jgi:hypothetical protein
MRPAAAVLEADELLAPCRIPGRNATRPATTTATMNGRHRRMVAQGMEPAFIAYPLHSAPS